ncbi:thermonuclease family protein [Sphingomonas cannabina]|uniref:thermonuclease family protein n=1 Tax=Sphingomonas cannabina TaxID=2899123 RepID=UPI001F48F122|nr:thermonuclease family protein [Sphingomonas cannabina]UIJ44778.1 thermonuclease family protein [Sphingomonas cannabina]
MEPDHGRERSLLPSARRVAFGLAALILATAAADERGRIAYVTDGDTVRLESGERIRIAGIDAPEIHRGQARCRAELARGRAAAEQARALLGGRVVSIARVGRSYDRTVARLRLDGRDVAAELVRIGAARWWPRGRAKPSWCGRAAQR